MSNGKALPQFDIFTTKDLSPTMSLFGGEKMHSLEGALSESLYIYGSGLEKGLKFSPPKVLSMGLGLGYNENIAIALFLKHSIDDFQVHSFEKVPFLRSGFMDWVHGHSHPFADIHNKILQQICKRFEVTPETLLKFVKHSLEEKKLVIHSSLTEENQLGLKFNIILYDAFSSETDNDLWTQSHLEDFFKKFCEQECLFTTYAATGNLKRALKAQGFNVKKKKGLGLNENLLLPIEASLCFGRRSDKTPSLRSERQMRLQAAWL